MYTFFLKDNGPDVDIMVTRALLALAAVASFVYRTDDYFYINIAAAVVLLLAAVFIKTLVQKFKLHKLLLLGIASILLFIATRSFAFAAILLVYGSILKYFYKTPSIEISAAGISIKKLFLNPFYPWDQFSNVILKDHLLTLDFKNNKLLQLSVDEKAVIDQMAFNAFCATQLSQ